MFLSLQTVNARKSKYERAIEVLKYLQTNTMEDAIQKFKRSAPVLMPQETPTQTIFDNSKVKQKLEAELTHFVSLFNVNSLPEKVVVSDIKGLIVEHMHTVATIINEELDDASFQKLLFAWPVGQVGFEFGGWIDLKHANGRQRVKESIILESGEILVDESVRETGIQTQQGTEISNIYSDLLGYVLFVYAALTSLTSNVFSFEAKLITLIQNAALTPKKNFRTLEVQAALYKQILTEIGLFKRLNIVRIESQLHLIQQQLEVIETLSDFRHADGSYNTDHIKSVLVHPLQAEVENNHWSFDNQTMSVFENLGLLEGSAVPYLPNHHLQTKYYHALSLAAQLVNGAPESETLERIQSEWPSSILQKKGSVYTV